MRPKKKNSLALTVLLLTRERASTTSLGESYLIFSLFRRSLSDVRACVVYTRVLGVTSPSIRLKLGLKVYQKRSKKEYFFVPCEAKTKKSSSEERATSPLLVGVRGQFFLIFARDHLFFFVFLRSRVSAFFSPLEGFFALSRFFAFWCDGASGCNRFLLTNEINMLYFYTHTKRYE